MLSVWITGASSGIGEACAYRYAEEGARLVLTSSSVNRLEPVAARCRELGATEVNILPCDLTCLDGIDTLTDKAWDAMKGIDIVMLNAGISQRTNVEDTSMEMVRKIMEINYFAPVAIAKRLLPKMVGRGYGTRDHESHSKREERSAGRKKRTSYGIYQTILPRIMRHSCP